MSQDANVGDTWKRGDIYKKEEDGSDSDDESEDDDPEVHRRPLPAKGPVVKVDNEIKEVVERRAAEQKEKAAKDAAPKPPLKEQAVDSGSESDTEEDDDTNWGYDTVKGRKIKDTLQRKPAKAQTTEPKEKDEDEDPLSKRMAAAVITEEGTRAKLASGTWASGDKASVRSTWKRNLWKQLANQGMWSIDSWCVG